MLFKVTAIKNGRLNSVGGKLTSVPDLPACFIPQFNSMSVEIIQSLINSTAFLVFCSLLSFTYYTFLETSNAPEKMTSFCSSTTGAREQIDKTQADIEILEHKTYNIKWNLEDLISSDENFADSPSIMIKYKQYKDELDANEREITYRRSEKLALINLFTLLLSETGGSGGGKTQSDNLDSKIDKLNAIVDNQGVKY